MNSPVGVNQAAKLAAKATVNVAANVAVAQPRATAVVERLNNIAVNVLGGAKVVAADQLARFPGKLQFPYGPRPWPFPFPMPRFPFKPFGNRGCYSRPSPRDPGLRTSGNTVDTGRYTVTVEEGRCKIYDKLTNTWVKCEGDPHLLTSDGDKGQFHENLTIDLPDDTKITIKCTEKDARGVAYIDAVAVMKGEEAVVISGVHDGKPGVEVGNVLNNADAVDRMWEDGTVMRAGREVDDLTFARDGKELVGTDPNARWHEHNLDGHGGVSRNRPDRRCGTEGTNGTSGASSVGGGSIWARLWAIIGRLQQQLVDKVDELDKLQQDQAKLNKTDTGKMSEAEKAQIKSDSGKIEIDIKKAFAEIQQLQDSIKQFTSTMTNLQKSDSDSKMAIARNLA